MKKTARSPQEPKSRLRSWFAAISAIFIILFASLVDVFILQNSMRIQWENVRAGLLAVNPLDVLFVAVIMACVWAVIGRLWWSVGVVSGLLVLLSIVNRNKLLMRQEPLFPSDRDFIGEIGFVASMVEGRTVLIAVLGVLALILVITLIGWIAGRWFPRPRLRRPEGGINKGFLAVRVVTFVLAGGLLVHSTSFNESPNLWRASYDAAGASWMPWDQVYNYRMNGVIGGFLYNMPVQPMDTPEGYDAAAMDEISERYAERADQINADREGSLDDVNVVFVLSESFTDPSWMEGFDLDTNPIPSIQQVMSESISGQVYANTYGGGTSTMEFESLTGEPVGLFRPQASSPYQMFVSDYDTYPSAVGAFNELGHHTVAFHAYNLQMYKRQDVYRTLGFDDVVDDAGMQHQERVQRNPYISDASAYDEVVHQLDSSQDPVFLNLVTMQNHGPYPDYYDDPIGNDAPGLTQLGQYARGLAHTDAATRGFLDELQSRDEETIVVFYGDHHPGIYDEETLAANDEAASVRTPYFVWNSKTNEAQPGAAITPAMLLPMVYESADAPVPPYIALLEDVRRSIPVLQHARTLDPQGQPVDRDNLDEPTQTLLDDLTKVQYDFSIGDRYAVDSMWPGAAEEH